ncbi:hypothetical protein KR026_000238 [Drosophila bipectinata]|nr:hypothetical protein KR026_000238 [Drosophila bipectinata]
MRSEASISVFILSLVSLVPVAISLRSCRSHEICVGEKLCNDSDDSGRGVLIPRSLDNSCGHNLVCCEKEQLESYYAEQADLQFRSQKKGNPWGTSEIPTTSFHTTEKSIPAKNEEQGYKSCGIRKECVPRHLCLTGKVNEDGRYIVGPRIGDNKIGCRSVEECCPLDDHIAEDQSPTNRNLKNFRYRSCGYSNPNGLYYKLDGYNDNESTFAEFPWMVALMDMEGNYICGGSLIHPQLVLTSAHNVANYSEDSLLARAGDWDLNSQSEPHPYQMRRVSQVMRHEGYNNLTFYNDIALVMLERPFQLAPHIQPICLPPPETPQLEVDLSRAKCLATGWGHSNSTSDLLEHLLKRIELPVVDHDSCQKLLRLSVLGRRYRLHPSFLCAGGVEGKDTCKGDGGSPLFCTMPGLTDRFYLAGIVSWGIECAVKDIPAAYANVAYLRNWIDEKVAESGIFLE